MDYQPLFNIAVGCAAFLGGWWMKTMHESLKDLRQDDQKLADKVAAIEVLVAGQYVTRDDMKDFAEAIFKKLDRIEIKLDGKVDRQ